MVTLSRGAPPSAMKPRCGMCYKSVEKRDKVYDYTTDCLVCNDKCWLHPKCAMKLFKNRVGAYTGAHNHQAKSQVFRQSQVNLWCSICEDDCYLCDAKHESE